MRGTDGHARRVRVDEQALVLLDVGDGGEREAAVDLDLGSLRVSSDDVQSVAEDADAANRDRLDELLLLLG